VGGTPRVSVPRVPRDPPHPDTRATWSLSKRLYDICASSLRECANRTEGTLGGISENLNRVSAAPTAERGMLMDIIGPTAQDETHERYAACADCGSRITHRRDGDTWHCHACGAHWREEGSYYWGLPVDDRLIMDPCAWEDWDLWE
jgi:hypothetical protein